MRNHRLADLRCLRLPDVAIEILICILVRIGMLVIVRRNRSGIVLVPVNHRRCILAVVPVFARPGWSGWSGLHGQGRRTDEMRPVHDQCATTAFKLFVLAMVNRSSGFVTNRHRMYLLFRHGGNVMHRDAGIDDSSVVLIEIKSVNVFSACINMLRFLGGNAVAPRIPVAEIPRPHKREGANAQIELETNGHRAAVVNQSDARPVDRVGWQWRPPAVIVVVTPADPGWRPNRVRPPAPAVVRDAKPAAIVERCPAPGITRKPIPAIIGINPMSVVAIRLPAGLVNYHRWPPAPAITGHVHPCAIRSKRVVKIINRHFSRLRCAFRCGNRLHRLGGRNSHLFQLLIALHHSIDEFRRHAKVVQINDLVRIEIEKTGRIIDVVQNDTLFDAGLHQTDDLRERTVWINVRR